MQFYNSGHMVPRDQPKVSLEMLQSWMKGNFAMISSRNCISSLRMPLDDMDFVSYIKPA